MNIVLIGFMGTGKSAVGRNLARRLEARHLDTDAEIEREAGQPIPQIFADEGEAAFRARETALLSRLWLPRIGAGRPSYPFHRRRDAAAGGECGAAQADRHGRLAAGDAGGDPGACGERFA